jgi:hypothetical protein
VRLSSIPSPCVPNFSVEPRPIASAPPSLRPLGEAHRERECAKRSLALSCRVQVPAESGRTSHAYRVLQR